MIDVMKRRLPALAVLLGATAMLGGCVYDPYTGGYYPCCSTPAYRAAQAGYPYPPPGYPPPGQPQGQMAPQGQMPPQAQMMPQGQMAPQGQMMPQGQMAPPGDMTQPREGAGGGQRGGKLAERFGAANVTHDGRLTMDQAQAAGWHVVARNFTAMDTGQKGYLTLHDVRSWAASHRQSPGGAGQPTG